MTIALLLCALLSGCNRRPSIKSGGMTITGPDDAGKPATLATATAGTTVPLPAGSTITVTKIDAVAAQARAGDVPAVAAQPAREITVISPAGPTQYVKTENTVRADTGTVDTSIAMKKIDAAESRILLYASIAAALAAGLFVYIKYPTPAIACGVASVIFFLAWKLSDLPNWFYVVGVIAVAGGVALWHGHEKGLYTPVPDDK